MKKINSLAFILVVMLALFSQISSAKAISDDNVKQYLALSGIDSALDGIPAQMNAMGQQMQITVKDPAQAQRVVDLLLNAWQIDEVRLIVAEHVKENFSTVEMKSLLTWLNSDLARKIKSAEEKAAAANFNQEFMTYMAQLQTTPPTTARVQVIREFIDTTHIVDHSLNIVMSVAQGTMEGLNAANPEQAVSDEQMRTQLSQMQIMMRPALEQQLVMVSYYIYQQLTEQEIVQYTKFYQQPLGQKELDIMYDGIGQALNYWSTSAFANIAAEFTE